MKLCYNSVFVWKKLATSSIYFGAEPPMHAPQIWNSISLIDRDSIEVLTHGKEGKGRRCIRTWVNMGEKWGKVWNEKKGASCMLFICDSYTKSNYPLKEKLVTGIQRKRWKMLTTELNFEVGFHSHFTLLLPKNIPKNYNLIIHVKMLIMSYKRNTDIFLAWKHFS